MEERFYTIDQVAQILGMHHKTIRKFISDSKLNANKVGKQWRIAKQDLDAFMEINNNNGNSIDKNTYKESGIEFTVDKSNPTNKFSKVNVSTVIDINEVDREEYERLSSLLLAIMNSSDARINRSTMNLKYTENENKLRVMLWGNIKFTEELLDSISILTQ